MQYFEKWVKAANASDPFDDYVVVSSSPIGAEEMKRAETYLSHSDEHVVTDDAMTFVVYLDLELQRNPTVAAEIKQKAFDRLHAAAKKQR